MEKNPTHTLPTLISFRTQTDTPNLIPNHCSGLHHKDMIRACTTVSEYTDSITDLSRDSQGYHNDWLDSLYFCICLNPDFCGFKRLKLRKCE